MDDVNIIIAMTNARIRFILFIITVSSTQFV